MTPDKLIEIENSFADSQFRDMQATTLMHQTNALHYPKSLLRCIYLYKYLDN